ncbi:MAG: MFS transporter [Dehalococcoidia bacterium]
MASSPIVHSVPGRRVYYGWWIVAAAAVIFGVSASLSVFALGALYVPLEAEFGWSRGQVSAALSLSFAAGGVIAPFLGRILDRFGPRVVTAVGGIVLALSVGLLAAVTAYWQLAVLLMVMSLGRIASTNLTISAMLVAWFVRFRGLAIGLTRAGLSVATVFGVPATAAMVTTFGWRSAMLLNGLVLLAVIAPLALLVFRRSPAEFGLYPDGSPAPPAPVIGIGQASGETLSTSSALRTPAFWALAIAMNCFFFAEAALALHAQPFFASRGLDYQTAAAVAGSIPAAYLLGGLLIAPLAARFAARRLLAVAFVLVALGLAGFWVAAPTPFVWAVSPLFGLGAGAVLSLQPALIADLFGLRSYGAILGVASLVNTIGLVTGPVVTGYAYDLTGSYAAPWIAFIIAEIAGGVIVLLARRPPEVEAG